ncbi:translation initiation factor IF-3 [Opitutus sp. ER46]|uniref:translation initiation factor IF-3 n=1 Tax=Opitutus sp. ER46 TaxID=2161864 RepID=UPI000D2FF19E|nr:translation initiation factor IF-3 [Opitutus sp. ER46]PTX97802.1 translation initiation factor IF-3 [Opitutus sp. ER46]
MATSFPSAGGNRPGHFQRRNTDPFAAIRRNHRIKVPQVRVISPEGKQLGIMDTPKAINLALEVGLDLVEFAPNANPPVCRIIDFGKYVYEEQKKHSHAKATGSKIKEIEFTARIEQHDYETKLRHGEQFLSNGNKVKMRLKFRGREMAHTEIGFNVMKRAVADLAGMGTADSEPKLIGRNINVMLTPLPVNKRKPKFFRPGVDEEVEEDEPIRDTEDNETSGSQPTA